MFDANKLIVHASIKINDWIDKQKNFISTFRINTQRVNVNFSLNGANTKQTHTKCVLVLHICVFLVLIKCLALDDIYNRNEESFYPNCN